MPKDTTTQTAASILHKYCPICYHAKPCGNATCAARLPPPDAGALEKEEWRCSCGVSNEPDSDSCRACSAPKAWAVPPSPSSLESRLRQLSAKWRDRAEAHRKRGIESPDGITEKVQFAHMHACLDLADELDTLLSEVSR